MSQTDSITHGFRVVLRDPVIFLMELVWRWSFGALAFLLLFFTGFTLLGSVGGTGWTTRDPLLITIAALRLGRDLAHRPLLLLLALAITILWITFGALGRTVILKRLSGKPGSIGFRNIVALHTWRAVFVWVGIAGVTVALMFCVWIAMRGDKPDYLIFYVTVFPLLAVIVIFCSVVNWYLSLAMVCAQGDETSKATIQRAMVLSGSQTGAVVGISVVFAALRVLAVLVAFVVIVFSLGLMVSTPRLLLAWSAVVALAYCAWADFLYVCRLAAYATLVPTPQPAGLPLVPPMQETSVATSPNGHH